MTDHVPNPGPLPAVKLQNAGEAEDARGALGNEAAGRMFYTGGDREDLVRTLQAMLRDLGYDVGNFGPAGDGIDGKFGKKTEDAVKQYQERNMDWGDSPLKADGLVGPRTADSLNRSMVGTWYDEYPTPKGLTKSYLRVTATGAALMAGLSLDVKGIRDVKMNLVAGEYAITLRDHGGNRLSYEGERHYIVRDSGDNIIAEGNAVCSENITFTTTIPPQKVELDAGGDLIVYFISAG